MDPITIAMGLAQFAPGIIKWMTGSDKAADVAGKVIDVAKAVTGKDTPEGALQVLQADPALVMQFQQSMAQLEADLDRAYLADRQDARKRDAALIQAGLRNHRADTMYVLAVCVIVGLVYAVWQAADMSEFTKGVITLVLGRFLGYLDGIYNFEFGTTRTSRTKDMTIDQLTRGRDGS